MRRPNSSDDAGGPPRLVAVAVPVPVLGPLIYQVPKDIDVPVVGARVLVPLGARLVTGIVVESHAAGDEAGPEGATAQIRPLADVLDRSPFLPEAVVRLALWTAEYYACGAGEAVAAAMPPLAGIKSECRARLTAAGAMRRLARSGGRGRLRAVVLGALSEERWTSVGAIGAQVRRGRESRRVPAPIQGVVHALEREGLVETETVLKGRRAGFKTVRVVRLAEEAMSTVREKLGAKQRQALDMLGGRTDGIEVSRVRESGVSAGTIARLRERGLVLIEARRAERDPFTSLDEGGAADLVESRNRSLTKEQNAALQKLEKMAAEAAFKVALVHGVTGSGKTELYARLAATVIGAGRRVLVLVPEIALTPALAAVFRAVFGNRVAIQHSGLADGERHDQWQRIRSGEIDVVVGTRSAAFAPLAPLGLIIVDEEHDTSYKQEESPRYHGRDLAIVRGRQADALVVLGSATPSLESYSNARAGRYELLTLERRVLDRPLAAVRIVNMREELAASGPDVVLSAVLIEAMAARLAGGGQVLILLNRRGFATSVFCRQCGATLDCPNCSVSLTVHGGRTGAPQARCHYCNYTRAVPSGCAQCAGPYLMHTGFGTERVEQEVRAALPGARVARLDRDTARQRSMPAALLGRFARGDLDVLVGTQMIAKGHDFPRVTLVGVVSADVGLGLADFRAAERTFQLLTQVVGRAGRGEQPGEAIIQTLFPEHYSIQHACRQDYVGYFQDEIRFRRAMRYPPAIGLINVVVRGKTLRDALDVASELARAARERLPRRREFEVLGPAPAPIVKLRGESRAQFFLKGPRRLQLRAALDGALAARPDVRRKVAVDVDPVSVL